MNELVFILAYDNFQEWYSSSYPDNLVDPTKQGILFTVLAFGSRVVSPKSAEHYLNLAKSAVGSIMATASLEAIQALILLVK